MRFINWARLGSNALFGGTGSTSLADPQSGSVEVAGIHCSRKSRSRSRGSRGIAHCCQLGNKQIALRGRRDHEVPGRRQVAILLNLGQA